MADVTPSSTTAQVESFVRNYIYTDEDGSQRVRVSALADWVKDQFVDLVGTRLDATDADKDAAAERIANALQSSIAREHWMADPNYPHPAQNTETSATDRMVELADKAIDEIHGWEANYRSYQSAIGQRAKALFNAQVAPSFPQGIDLIETSRVYIETFVTDRGEESAPSDASSMVTLDQNDSATITGNAPPAGRNITYRRLYRSATGTSQSAYRLQGQYPIGQTVITDTLLDTQLNEVCPSFGWDEPPAGLSGLTGMANGIMLGFEGRTLYACEPYKPYAWPLKYTKPLGHQIVGVAALGQAAFIGTVGQPYIVSGSDSASLSQELVPANIPCESAASMVAIGGSVFYAAPEGLALYENGDVHIVSAGALDRAAWQDYNPSSMRAAAFDGRYFAFFTRADNTRGALVFDYKTRSLCELDQGADAVFANQDGLYVLDGTSVLEMLPAAGAGMAGEWHSKTWRLPKPQSFCWLLVDFAGPSATVKVYADGSLHHSATVTGRQPVRLPPGRFAEWRVEVVASARIDGVVLASSTDELKAVP